MRRAISALVAATILVGAIGSPVWAASPCPGSGYGMRVYEHINYGGASLLVCEYPLPGYMNDNNVHSAPLVSGWGDRVSSYKVFYGAGRGVRFYENTDFGGLTLTTYGSANIPDLRAYYPYRWDGFNDTISSWKVVK